MLPLGQATVVSDTEDRRWTIIARRHDKLVSRSLLMLNYICYGFVAPQARLPPSGVSTTWSTEVASHPDDEDIRTLLRRSGQRLTSTSRDVCEMKILDFVDAPFRIPLIGKFQRRHRHYDCGLVPRENPESLPPVTVKRNELRWIAW